jgi:hypothetical protein
VTKDGRATWEVSLASRDYYRGDQKAGISAPNLLKACTYADHVVSARGRKTRYTSVSLDRGKIERFGEVDYLLLREGVDRDGHSVIEHETLVKVLRETASEGEKAERLKAVRALHYALLRKEGLVDWKFDISRVDEKNVITFAHGAIQKYFRKI